MVIVVLEALVVAVVWVKATESWGVLSAVEPQVPLADGVGVVPPVLQVLG